MLKAELRKIYKEKRMALSVKDKLKLDDLLLIQFQKLQIDIPNLIMTYSPFEKYNEFNPELITDYCYFKSPNQTLFFPKIDELEDTMFCEVVNDETTFELNKYGIAEPVDGLPMFPEEIDLILVPLLAFDKHGYRVGYGKGYYDKFFKECREDVVKIGISYFDPIDAIDDVNAFDVKLDYCITPHNNYTFI
jgi:5-formyltetrahydrofolate cyclo-ligase